MNRPDVSDSFWNCGCEALPDMGMRLGHALPPRAPDVDLADHERAARGGVATRSPRSCTAGRPDRRRASDDLRSQKAAADVVDDHAVVDHHPAAAVDATDF